MRYLWRRISVREEGVSLVELLSATLIMGLVTASMLTFFATIQRTAARESSRSETTDALRVAMDRMTKDIRQATFIRPGAAASYLDMDTFINGVSHRVTYDAGAGNRLTRSIDGGGEVILVERLQTTALFSFAPNTVTPSVITVTIVSRPETFARDQADVTLTSEVKLRNR